MKTGFWSQALTPSTCERATILLALILACASPLQAQFVIDPEKTDSLRLRNGDWMAGELQDMSLGIVTYKTDAMSTVYVKWPRVLTVTTEKRFQILLEDGRRYYGSLRASETLGWVVIRGDRDTLEVATQSVVELKRIKETFWSRLDGSFDFGFGFTQQNAKTDLSLLSETRYLVDRNRFSLTLDGSVSRQDSVSDVTRGTGRILYIRELAGLWFLGFSVSGEHNSQLSLDVRGSLRGGPGRYFIANSRMELGSLLEIGYSRERFAGEAARNTLPLAFVTDYRFFDWSGLDTNLSSRLSIEPVLDDRGRWRISFTANLTQEIVDKLYLRLGVVEEYDSRPPSAEANKNDFRITTSVGFTY